MADKEIFVVTIVVEYEGQERSFEKTISARNTAIAQATVQSWMQTGIWDEESDDTSFTFYPPGRISRISIPLY
jgi:P pilus assembly chaperone PapD